MCCSCSVFVGIVVRKSSLKVPTVYADPTLSSDTQVVCSPRFKTVLERFGTRFRIPWFLSSSGRI